MNDYTDRLSAWKKALTERLVQPAWLVVLLVLVALWIVEQIARG